MNWVTDKLISCVGFPVLWLGYTVFYFAAEIWDCYTRILDAINDWFNPTGMYYNYTDQQGNTNLIEYSNQRSKESKMIAVAEEYYEILRVRMSTASDIEELNRYGDRIDRMVARRYFPVKHYQDLISIYYKKLEELESLAELDETSTKRSM